MERKIGEVFEWKGKTVEVKRSGKSCKKCFLKTENCDIDGFECRKNLRLDKENVIFKEITNVTLINDITDPEFSEPQMSYE